jgi:hypothetical protein
MATEKIPNDDSLDMHVEKKIKGWHSPNVSTILLRFFYDFSMIIPRAQVPAFPR